jgi:hypothetical protein
METRVYYHKGEPYTHLELQEEVAKGRINRFDYVFVYDTQTHENDDYTVDEVL